MQSTARHRTLIVSTDTTTLIREAAQRMQTVLQAAGKKQKKISIALAGGTTPKSLYKLLAQETFCRSIPWEKIHLFWGDERMVPHHHPASNYGMAQQTLLQYLPLPAANIHPVPTHLTTLEAAQSYEQQLRKFFRLRRGFPVFDLVLLGLGTDGHTASLFPSLSTLAKKGARVTSLVTTWVTTGLSPTGEKRVTLTLPVLNNARQIFFLVQGPTKAAVLQKTLEETGPLPAQQIAPTHGELVWFADSAAAKRLTQWSPR